MVFSCHFMNYWSWGYFQNEHWNGPKIKKLYSWSWSCEVVVGNFLFSERFNGELFLSAFRIYLFFCQKHTPKSRKFNVLPYLTSNGFFGVESNIGHKAFRGEVSTGKLKPKCRIFNEWVHPKFFLTPSRNVHSFPMVDIGQWLYYWWIYWWWWLWWLEVVVIMVKMDC